MKEPIEITEHVKVTWWRCNVMGHRHTSRQAAAACMTKRKGEAGELRKLLRNLAMIEKLREGHNLVTIASEHNCSDGTVMKAVNSSLAKAYKLVCEAVGNSPYPKHTWMRGDFLDSKRQKELDFYVGVLKEYSVKLERLASEKG